MKKILAICVLLSVSFFAAGCSGPKKEKANDSDAVSDDDIETADPENDDSEDDDIFQDEDERSDEDSGEEADEEDETDDFSLIQECFGKKLLVHETVSVDEYDYSANSYEYYIDRWYDNNCRIKFESKYYLYPNGKVGKHLGRSYKYDDKGNVKQICKRSKNGEIMEKCQRFSYEFNLCHVCLWCFFCGNFRL